jgi:hypothetical protein
MIRIAETPAPLSRKFAIAPMMDGSIESGKLLYFQQLMRRSFGACSTVRSTAERYRG